MAESLTSQTVIGFSTAPEASYGTNPVTAGLYTPMVTRARDLPVPDSDRADDRGVIGRGNAMYPSFQRSGFRQPTSFEITDMVQVGTLAPLIRRFCGAAGVAPVLVEAAIAFRHTFTEADPDTAGLQLPSSSFVYQNNEYDYLHPGTVGSALQVSQNGVADPSFSLQLVGSGQARRISEDYPGFGTLAVPSEEPYMYGASSAMQYTDELSATISLTTPTHKLRSQSFSVNNALITDDTRQGMPQLDAAEPRRGWYRNFLHFGDREVSAEFTMGMDGDYSLKDAEELNTAYTNWTWTMKGDLIPTTAASNRYEMKIVIPKFYLRSPRTGEENVKRTKTFTVFPVIHGGGYGVYNIEVVNGVSGTIS